MEMKSSWTVTLMLLFLISNFYVFISYRRNPMDQRTQMQSSSLTTHIFVNRSEEPNYNQNDTKASQIYPYRWSPYESSTEDPILPPNLSPIPPIIHQFWDTYSVPEYFVRWIQTWVTINPGYEYWFWTPDDIRVLIKDNNMTEYLDLYNGYNHNQSRANVGRYLIMAFIGGFYADLDMDCLRPLESWRPYGCILTEETYPHSFMLHKRSQPSVMNTFLGCRPHHNFYEFLPTGLKEEVKIYPKDVLKQCGVWYFDKMYRKYGNESKGVNHIKTSADFLMVLHPKYFLPTYDKAYCMKCMCFTMKKQSQLLHELCTDMEKYNFRNEPYPESFANHHWVHVIMNETKWHSMKAQPIQDIVPQVKTYRNITQGIQISKYFPLKL